MSSQVQLKNKEKIKIYSLHPKLVIIQVENDFASNIYVNKKKKWGKNIGISVEVYRYDTIAENKLIDLIHSLNADEEVHGIIVQLPLPKTISMINVLMSIAPEKDVDGLTPLSLGALYQNQEIGFASATPLAVMEVLKYISIYSDGKYTSEELDEEFVDTQLKKYLSGKRVLIINRSNIVGKPLAALLIKNNATVTIAHSQTINIDTLIKSSDIVVSGTGKIGFVNKDNISKGAILIDVGINKSANGVSGDVDYRGAVDKIEWLTPVPNGIGPLTVAMLLSNTIKACILQTKKDIKA